VKSYPAGVAKPGDIYIMNDPYDGGTHLPDVLIAEPVFSDSVLVGYAATMCHHQDIGGSAPGSTAPDAVDIHAEGLRIPLLKLFDAGVPDHALFALIESNVRVPRNFKGDLEAQLAACGTGAERLAEVCREWGTGVVFRAAEDLMAYAERLTRVAIEAFPDGDYEFTDHLDDDGIGSEPVAIRVTARIRGSDIHFDFTGTSPQVRGAINCVESSTLSAVYYVVRALTGAHIPNNDGCYRPVSTTLPEGSIVNCMHPAPVGSRAITMKRIVDALFGALAEALPELVPAASSGQTNIMYVGGYDPTVGRRYVGFIGVPLPGGMGARPDQDGVDVVETDVTNNKHYPTEACESDLPIRIDSIRLWTDSGGPGEYRGGLGYTAEVVWLAGDALVTIRRDRHKFAPWGLSGGLAGWPCRTLMERADGTSEELPSKKVFAIHAGDTLRIWTAGGGGYGRPTDRDPAAVLSDVFDRRVSQDLAEDVYGVVIDGKDVDVERTAAQRSKLREAGLLQPQVEWH
jgi:N-methylhydantoinase B/oxoprolinase/acetone carboxylase alpha subunit